MVIYVKLHKWLKKNGKLDLYFRKLYLNRIKKYRVRIKCPFEVNKNTNKGDIKQVQDVNSRKMKQGAIIEQNNRQAGRKYWKEQEKNQIKMYLIVHTTTALQHLVYCIIVNCKVMTIWVHFVTKHKSCAWNSEWAWGWYALYVKFDKYLLIQVLFPLQMTFPCDHIVNFYWTCMYRVTRTWIHSLH